MPIIINIKNMQESLIQVKRSKIIDMDKNQNSKFKIIDSTFKKYIDITLCRFNSKCSMLINLIEEMKREFNAQIEGMKEFFPSSYHKVALPYVSSNKKTNRLFSDNSTTKIDSNNSQEQYHERHLKGKKLIKSPLMRTEYNKMKLSAGQTLNIDNKISLKLQGIREIQDHFNISQINESLEIKSNCNPINNNHEAFNKIKNIQSKKNQSLCLIANSM